jgi:putative sterol carrier protein
MAELPSVQAYFDTLDQRFKADAAKGLNAVFRFELAGDNGGTYHIAVNDGKMEWKKEAHPSPGVTIKMSADDYLKMVNGKLNGMMAYTMGKMKVAGNTGLAMKMQAIFPVNK